MVKYRPNDVEMAGHIEFNSIADMLWYIERSTQHEIKVEEIAIGKSCGEHTSWGFKSMRYVYRASGRNYQTWIGVCDFGERG